MARTTLALVLALLTAAATVALAAPAQAAAFIGKKVVRSAPASTATLVYTTGSGASSSLAGATLSGTVTVDIEAGTSVQWVRFWLDGEIADTDSAPPFQFPDGAWDTTGVADGTHTLSAKIVFNAHSKASVTATFGVANGGRSGTTTTTRPPRDTTTTTTPRNTTTTTAAPTESGSITGFQPGGFTVPAGQTAQISGLVETDGNVIVEGTLIMRSGATLRFVNVDDSKFVGGGMVPLPTDVGLWVVGAGVLDAQGTPVTPWAYSWQSGWKASDDIVATPNTEGDYTTFKQVDGPGQVPPANEYGYKAELLNLTRDVKIEGTAAGNAHLFIKSTSRSTVKYVELTHMGVKVKGNDQTGRYAFHLHHNGDATRGMSVVGVVAHDLGNHAFVVHASNGVTLDHTIAYDTVEAAYWWDDGADSGTKDLTYLGTVGAKVKTTKGGNGDIFHLGASGSNLTVTGSVAVGEYGNNFDAAGFEWPGTGRSVWNFSNNVSHNNEGHGINVWQNTATKHVITDFTGYYNGHYGISHGAYNNPYQYSNLELWGNGKGAIESHANAKYTSDGETQTWTHVRGDGIWHVSSHGQGGTAPIIVTDVVLPGLVVDEGKNGSWFQFNDAKFGSVDLSGASPATVIEGL